MMVTARMKRGELLQELDRLQALLHGDFTRRPPRGEETGTKTPRAAGGKQPQSG
jgi:hypothetical protein